MAVANNEIQVQWDSGTNSKSVSASGIAVSDAFNFSSSAVSAMITLKADNSGTPVSGDNVECYVLLSCGDPDGSGANEYPNSDSDGFFLALLDTNEEDPTVVTVELPVAAGAKIYVINNASSNSIAISACINEKVIS
jgi:hypothetical protein